MINDEMSGKVITMAINVGKLEMREIIKMFEEMQTKSVKEKIPLGKFIEKSFRNNGKPLKEMVSKGQLENVNVSDKDIKELKKNLNKYGVQFSVMKDRKEGGYTLFFQSKDVAVMEKALNNVMEKALKKNKIKESTMENLKNFKEKVKDAVNKDKIRNKQQEQSL